MNFHTLLGTINASELGHLDQERSNLQSTKLQEEDEDFFLLKQTIKRMNFLQKFPPLLRKKNTIQIKLESFLIDLVEEMNICLLCLIMIPTLLLIILLKHAREKK